MSLQKREKIKSVIQHWPEGMVVTYDWLKQYHISRQLVHRYINSGWISSIASGAFVKFNDKPSLSGVVYALQTQHHLPIHIGGLTALNFEGYTHYIRFNENVFIYGAEKVKLPRWIEKVSLQEGKLIYRSTNLFGGSDLGLNLMSHPPFKILCSSPERAILEVLAFVPQQHAYEEAAHIMENMMTLRPTLINELLSLCHSIKVKRLFLHLAEQCHAPWLEHLTFSSFDLGHGIRVIDQGKRFDKKYELYVPENPLNEGVNDDE